MSADKHVHTRRETERERERERERARERAKKTHIHAYVISSYARMCIGMGHDMRATCLFITKDKDIDRDNAKA